MVHNLKSFRSFRYDPEKDTWTMVSPMKTKRIGVGCAVANRILYAVGGFDGRNRLKSVEKYTPETDEWCFVKAMNIARSGAGKIKLISSLIIINFIIISVISIDLLFLMCYTLCRN